MIYPRFLFIRTKYVLLSSHFYKNRQHMRITHPRLANALHESTNIQTVLEKNDEDLIEYSFKSLRIEGIKKSNYKNISLTRKVTLFSIKHKMYFITEQICIFRQKQNNKKREKK